MAAWTKKATVKAPGDGEILLLPCTKMIRIPRNRPDRAFLEAKVVRMPGFQIREPVKAGDTVKVGEWGLVLPPIRVTGVRAYHRAPTEAIRERDETTGRLTMKVNVKSRWELLGEWTCSDGESASQAKLKLVREGAEAEV